MGKLVYCIMCQQTKRHLDFDPGLEGYSFHHSSKNEGMFFYVICRSCKNNKKKWGKLSREAKIAYIKEGADRCLPPGQVVYKLTDPETGEIRYIGRTNDVKRRMKDHCKLLRGGPWHPHHIKNEAGEWVVDLTRPFETRGYWMWKLKQKGLRPRMEVVYIPNPAVYIHEWEQRYIYHGLQCGWPLTNTEAVDYDINRFQHIDFLNDPFEKLLEEGIFREKRIEQFFHDWYEG